MTTFHFYDQATGRFTGESFTGSEADIAAHNPRALPYASNVPVPFWLHAVVDGQVVNRTAEETTAAARRYREGLLRDSDWIVAKSTEREEPVPQAWKDYRQALRDVTQQPGFPNDVEWPTPPN